MADFIVIAVIAVLISLASYKLWRDKQNGVKCAGCPQAPKSGKPSDSCGCQIK